MATKNAKAANGKAGGNKTDKKSGGGATKGAKAEARKGSGGGTKAAKAETKGPSKRRQIKAILVKKPSTPVDDLIAKFGGKGGLSELSITSMRSDTLDTLKVAAEAGFWKGPALPERGGARE